MTGAVDITVKDAEGLPDKAFVSIRVGEVRRQAQFKAGECFRFDVQQQPRHFTVDVFEKVASKQVLFPDPKQCDNDALHGIELLRKDGGEMKMSVKLGFTGATELAATTPVKPQKASRHQAALKAKNYLDDHRVAQLLQDMVHSLLREQPADPLAYMTKYIGEQKGKAPPPLLAPPKLLEKSPPGGIVKQVPAPPAGRLGAGLGDDEYPGFAADGSSPLPDLSHHASLVAQVLQENPSLYAALKNVRTSLGVTLAKCIKTGIDNRGHKMIMTTGICAGDEHCYEVFKSVFGPVIQQWHGDRTAALEDLDVSKVSSEPIDPSGQYVVCVQVRGSRNFSGVRMPSAISREERKEVERVVSEALNGVRGDLEGEYHALRGSWSYLPTPGGMVESVEADLRMEGLLPEEPVASVLLSTGMGRHWPEARGVFASKDKQLTVRVNEVDHIQIFSRRQDGNLRVAFERFARASQELQQAAVQSGYGFARSADLGFLTACPSNVGTALHVGAVLRLPQLGSKSELRELCTRLGLAIRRLVDENDGSVQWDVSAASRLGPSEAEQVATVVEGCQKLVEVEKRLKVGEKVDFATVFKPKMPLPTVVLPDPNEEEHPGFPTAECPAVMPSLDGKHSICADIMRKDPSIYRKLQDVRTPGGINLARCIKTCFDNNGHPMIKTIGAVAGDASCYDYFKDLFDPIIRVRHPNFTLGSGHRTDMDYTKVSRDCIDPDGTRVLSVRVRASRNLKDLAMTPACSIDERRQVERVVAEALSGVTGDLEGEYYPLTGSGSFSLQPQGMGDKEETLLAEGLLFEAPDSEVLLSSGLRRHWPDARGAFVSSSRSLAIWVNEEEHLRLISMQQGSDLRKAFERMSRIHCTLEAALQDSDHGFARSDRLGFLGACPSSLGTAMVASVTLRVPLLSAQPDFRAICRGLRLQAHLGVGLGLHPGDGIWEISNSERLGSTEVEQVNAVIRGSKALLEMEAKLERGEPLPSASAPFSRKVDPNSSSPRPAISPRPNFGEIPGLGSLEYPGASAEECPAQMPDLSKHHSLMAKVLRDDASIYNSLRNCRTTNGVGLAKCIKTGMDNKGHPMIKTVGAVAGDAESYEVFRALFDPIVTDRHPNYDAAKGHVSDVARGGIVDTPVDPTGKYIITSSVQLSRNVGGMRFLPAADRDERQEAERVLSGALTSLCGDLEGEYFPLRGSTSYVENPGGMSYETEALLEKEGVLFRESDAALVLASGTCRDWPEARGVFANTSRSFVAWVNEEDHLRLTSVRPGADLKAAFRQACDAERSVEMALGQEGRSFAYTGRLGYLTSCPSNLGSGMQAKVSLKLPKVAAERGHRKIPKNLRAHVTCASDRIEVSNADHLGTSEVAQVNAVLRVVALLVSLEQRLEKGEKVNWENIAAEADYNILQLRLNAQGTLLKAQAEGRLEAAIAEVQQSEREGREQFNAIPGLNDEEAPGFPADKCPEKMPDLSGHNSIASTVLRSDPSVYQRLQSSMTPLGTPFAKCIKPGMDCKGHPMIRTNGVAAGDAFCYETFKDLFLPVIDARHGGSVKSANSAHVTELIPSRVNDAGIDPSGQYVLTARVKLSRNLAGVRFPPAASRGERLEVERATAEALESLAGTLQGEYQPLQFSSSWAALPGGMTEDQAATLHDDGLLFEEPDTAIVLASGVGKNWPEARGVFTTTSRSLAVWVNEEDHLKLITTRAGPSCLKSAFDQLCMAEAAVREGLQQQGHEFARSDRLGFLTADPANVGSGSLQVSLLVRLPQLSGQAGFAQACRALGLQARLVEATGHDRAWKLFARGRLGLSEADHVNRVAAACKQLIDLERGLERGENVTLPA